ncbi:MAG: RelA/SpoT domain-containing protein [Nitrospira sp.]|nr:RelA/SpoT domain-containing protein [Nitrospira sp.]
MNDEEFRREYEQRLPDFERITDEIANSLQYGLSEKKIQVDAVRGRVKEFDSFMEKIRRKNLQNPFQEINDIVGIRVICLYRDDIEKIQNIVCDAFAVISDDDKTDSTESDRFGYAGSHIIARLDNKQNASLPPNLHNLRFEIQIRTIAQHAWASISHHLFYKKSDKTPKDLHAISALFYVADSHFLLLRNEQSHREQIQ